MTDHRRLRIWQAARELSRRIHDVVSSLPREEQFRRGDQIIRAASSVRHNIAEGAAGSDAQFANALTHAMCSANEVHDQLDDLDGIGFLRPDDRDLPNAYHDLAAMIAAFRRTIYRRIDTSKRRA